jgi:hypothetical protein
MTPRPIRSDVLLFGRARGNWREGPFREAAPRTSRQTQERRHSHLRRRRRTEISPPASSPFSIKCVCYSHGDVRGGGVPEFAVSPLLISKLIYGGDRDFGGRRCDTTGNAKETGGGPQLSKLGPQLMRISRQVYGRFDA